VNETDPSLLWPLAVYFACTLGVVAFMVGASYLLGQRHKDRATGEPYESGIVSEGSARLRFTARFYLTAMLFVIFDLEAVFIFTWAVAVVELGWTGYIVILIFIGLLLVALGYLWRVGALDWGPVRGKTSRFAREGCAENDDTKS
jgi:NADH-quinone oxidoreductase subunit A